MKKILLLAISTMFFAACGNNKKENVALEFTLTYDELAHMYPPSTNIIKTEKAHSGQYVLITDSINVFSQTFISTMQEISKQAISKITVSGFIKGKSMGSNGAIVVSVENATGQHFDYGSITCKQAAKELGEWVPFTLELPLKKESMDPNNLVKIYGWNYDSKDVTYFDDVTFTFQN